jgi:hypothetical protein
MKGQWIGTYTGASTGEIILNIDERPSYFQGVAYLNEENTNIPNTATFFRTNHKEGDFQFRTDLILPINPLSGVTDSWENVKRHYADDVSVSKFADVVGSWNGDTLSLSWTTDIGVSDNCTLPRSKAELPSELVPLDKEWESYKSYVASLEGRRYLFRGQNKPWRLRTSFHRAGRADLTRFLSEDIQTLHRQLSARTKHVFNLEIPNENGAFFNLVQHHGYPTPLLDWTYSPYVAAFFAYRGISKEETEKAAPTDKVRILVFDQDQWRSDWNQLLTLVNAGLHLSIGEFMAIENERMIPQQAASTVTNIDDIESYIRSKESQGKTYLSAIDLPVRDREKVVLELRYMGITAGSMFPGLDGACEELKERNFEI